jgi:hypothetical protein
LDGAERVPPRLRLPSRRREEERGRLDEPEVDARLPRSVLAKLALERREEEDERGRRLRLRRVPDRPVRVELLTNVDPLALEVDVGPGVFSRGAKNPPLFRA